MCMYQNLYISNKVHPVMYFKLNLIFSHISYIISRLLEMPFAYRIPQACQTCYIGTDTFFIKVKGLNLPK
jgi:hypothetical protein